MTVKYEFQGALYRCEREMLDAIAETWLSAGGANSAETQREFLKTVSTDKLADECIEAWGLADDRYIVADYDDEGSEVRQSHMEFNDYTAADLESAFWRLSSAVSRDKSVGYLD